MKEDHLVLKIIMIEAEIFIPEICPCDDPIKIGKSLTNFLIEQKLIGTIVRSITIKVGQITTAEIIKGIGNEDKNQ